MAKLVYTLHRDCLNNVEDPGIRWQIEGGKVLQKNKHVANYSSVKRVSCGTAEQNTAQLWLTLFYLGEKPPQNITLHGAHDFNSGGATRFPEQPRPAAGRLLDQQDPHGPHRCRNTTRLTCGSNRLQISVASRSWRLPLAGCPYARRMTDTVRLTNFSHGAGCGCKLGPDDLASVLQRLAIPSPPDEVLVAADTGDDAAVWRLSDGSALVATLDFFTPIVDEPYDWGRIVATNAMSDVYAMGGAPFLALNIVSWPVDDLPMEMLGQVLQGGIDAAAKAGVAVLGGHSITDPEPKYGMVVLGTVDPARMLRNSTARPGDQLFLTKPLGLGLISTAVKRGSATPNCLPRP